MKPQPPDRPIDPFLRVDSSTGRPGARSRILSRRRLLLWAAGLPLLASAACRRSAEEPAPPAIVYGEDVCDECGMILDQARYAAATLLPDGDGWRPLRFDDIGDMLRYHRSHPEPAPAYWYVHDHASEAWLDGRTATYVRAPQLRTPMASGLAAFATREAAQAFAAGQEDAVVLDFAGVSAGPVATPPDPV